jgi:hypothetical protein
LGGGGGCTKVGHKGFNVTLFLFQSTLEKESKKLEKMKEEENSSSSNISEDAIHLQEEKKEKLTYDVEKLDKEATLEQDKLTSTLLTLVRGTSRMMSHKFCLFSFPTLMPLLVYLVLA